MQICSWNPNCHDKIDKNQVGNVKINHFKSIEFENEGKQLKMIDLIDFFD